MKKNDKIIKQSKEQIKESYEHIIKSLNSYQKKLIMKIEILQDKIFIEYYFKNNPQEFELTFYKNGYLNNVASRNFTKENIDYNNDFVRFINNYQARLRKLCSLFLEYLEISNDLGFIEEEKYKIDEFLNDICDFIVEKVEGEI